MGAKGELRQKAYVFAAALLITALLSFPVTSAVNMELLTDNTSQVAHRHSAADEESRLHTLYVPDDFAPTPENVVSKTKRPYSPEVSTACAGVFVVIVVGLLVTILLPLVCFNARLVESDSSELYYSETRRGRTIKCYFLNTSWSGVCTIRLPDHIDPFSTQHKYSVVRRTRLWGGTDNLVVVWRNLIIYECVIRNICDIRIEEMLSESVKVVVADILDEQEADAVSNQNGIRTLP